MFSWNFAKKLFDGFTILRWTDFVRPSEYVQIEKAASQSILSYIIGKQYEEVTGYKLDWEFIVDSNIYSLLCKIATSDIKSTIGHRIKNDHLKELKDYVVSVYFDKDGKCVYEPQGLIDKDKILNYIDGSAGKNKDQSKTIEYEVCYLSHKFATFREFLQIEPLNDLSPDKVRVKNEINTSNLGNKVTQNNLRNIINNLGDCNHNLSQFFAYFEKLKPQVRWSQTCRIPQTTVLGHSMYVAMLTYFAIKELNIEKEENVLVNSFYAALFHDLPESLTRDIISPVKKNILQFEDQLSQYEFDEVHKKMISKIENTKWKNDFLYLLGENDGKFNAFENRKYILGELIETLDKTAAFVEAKMSAELGVNSDEIQKGIKNSSNAIRNKEFDYTGATDWKKSKKVLKLNDFLASIPQYREGV